MLKMRAGDALLAFSSSALSECPIDRNTLMGGVFGVPLSAFHMGKKRALSCPVLF